MSGQPCLGWPYKVEGAGDIIAALERSDRTCPSIINFWNLERFKLTSSLSENFTAVMQGPFPELVICGAQVLTVPFLEGSATHL